MDCVYAWWALSLRHAHRHHAWTKLIKGEIPDPKDSGILSANIIRPPKAPSSRNEGRNVRGRTARAGVVLSSVSAATAETLRASR